MPAILPVRPAETYLVLQRLAAGNAREPFRVVSLEIIGMSCRMPAYSGDLIGRHPAVLDKSTVHVRIRPVGQGTPHDRWNRVDDVAKLRFLCSDQPFRTTLLRHIGNRSHEPNIPRAIVRGVSGHMDMFNGTIRQLQPMLEIKFLEATLRSIDVLLRNFAIVGMNSRENKINRRLRFWTAL